MASPRDAGGVKFGTDGWRGIIAREFTFDNVARVATALAAYLQSEDRKQNLIYGDWGSDFRTADQGVVIGYDTRFLSSEFAHHFARIVADHGIPVSIGNAFAPTPALSYAVVDRQAACGIMFTSSHNPPLYNGIKIKAEYGGSAPASVTSAVEALLPKKAKAPKTAEADIPEIDLRTPFLTRVKELIDLDRLSSSDIHVVIDSMYGSAQGFVAEVLRDLEVPYTQIRGTRDVMFGGKKPEPLEENLIPLRAVIASMKRKKRRVLGVVTDGDGDRISAMDEKGGFIGAHRTYALILRYLVEERGWRGPIVASFNLSDLVRRMAAAYKLPVIEIPIGFKYAAEHILKTDVLMAGEESGSIAIRGHIPERDGVMLSLLLSEILASSKTSMSRMVAALHKDFGPQVYRRNDIELETRIEIVEKLKANPPEEFAGLPVKAVETLDGLKLRFEDGWLLFRASGTEPILRMYCEMTTAKAVDETLEKAEQLVR